MAITRGFDPPTNEAVCERCWQMTTADKLSTCVDCNREICEVCSDDSPHGILCVECAEETEGI